MLLITSISHSSNVKVCLSVFVTFNELGSKCLSECFLKKGQCQHPGRIATMCAVLCTLLCTVVDTVGFGKVFTVDNAGLQTCNYVNV